MKLSSTFFAISAGLVVFSTGASAQNFTRETAWMDAPKSHAECCANDKTFAHKAYMINLAEIEMGRLAQERATSAEVKAYADRMVADHEAANRQLMLANDTWGNDWPTKMDDKHQKAYNKLAALSGEAFDRNYMLSMKYGHRRAWNFYSKCGDQVYDSDLKAYVEGTKDSILSHMDHLAKSGYDAYTYHGNWRDY